MTNKPPYKYRERVMTKSGRYFSRFICKIVLYIWLFRWYAPAVAKTIKYWASHLEDESWLFCWCGQSFISRGLCCCRTKSTQHEQWGEPQVNRADDTEFKYIYTVYSTIHVRQLNYKTEFIWNRKLPLYLCHILFVSASLSLLCVHVRWLGY